MAKAPTPLQKRLRSSFQIALERYDKVATGSTLRSVEVRRRATGKELTYKVYAGPGFWFTQTGKRANTKLPVYKGADGKFHLFPEIQRWKKARGVTMPDFLLARAIARNARPPIDLIREAERDMQTYLEDMLKKETGLEDFLAIGLGQVKTNR